MVKELHYSQCYADLVVAVEKHLVSGLMAAQKALEYERLKTYWTIGRDIRQAIAASNGRLVASTTLYQRISRDLKKRTGFHLTYDTLRRVVQFNKNYPVFPTGSSLTFTHYMALQRIQDPKERARLEKAANKKEMSALDVKAAILRINRTAPPLSIQKGKLLKAERGEPFVYEMRLETGFDGKKHLAIDCGFKINIDPPEKKNIATYRNRAVRSIKTDKGYRLQLFKKGKQARYTYPAVVTRVIDGDTIDARIDIGFGIRLNERLRLKGINAPEVKTERGKSAKQFLARHFVDCPLIIIRTFKEGMYGRWLADIFTLAHCTDPYRIARKGLYLNQLMLNVGMADIYA